MLAEKCVGGVCFIPLDPSAPKLFGFPEFLTGLALMVIAWTISDVRYRFRVWTAPFPLLGITYVVVPAVGILTLLTDLWRAQGWYVPKGNLLTPASWQALLAALLLMTFLTWALFAFIRPPKFGKRNATRFVEALYSLIVKGHPGELAVIAYELFNSAKTIVRYATEKDEFQQLAGMRVKKQKPLSKTERRANELLLLIADKRFCRAIVDSSPNTAWAFFHDVGESRKYGIRIQTFAKNLVNEALANKDSFIYRETAGGYESGLIGYHQPVCQSMFSNYDMVETIETALDPDFSRRSNWDADQWEAYGRIVLLTFRDYVEKEMKSHSYVLYRALGYIEHAVSDLYKLDGVADGSWDSDVQARLRAVIDFVQEAVGILEKKGVPSGLELRINDKNRRYAQTIYDQIANLVYEVILAASAVKSPRDPCWWIQHNSVWGKLFNFGHLPGPAGAAVKFKVCRLLYQDVIEMKRFPNFKGARILSYCLNVMGLKRKEGDYDRDSRALHQAILLWTKKNYAWLYAENPRVAEACLADGMTWDAKSRRIVLTYLADGLRLTPAYVYLDVDPPPAQTGTKQPTPSQVATPRRRIKRLRKWESEKYTTEDRPFR